MKVYVNMEKNIYKKFADIEIGKQKFHKKPISIKNIDIKKIVVSNKVSFSKKGFKCFIGYKDAKKYIEETMMKLNMSFLIKGGRLLKKHNKIWEKVKNSIKKEFHSEPVYNEKYLKTKIKSYNEKINTQFHNIKI